MDNEMETIRRRLGDSLSKNDAAMHLELVKRAIDEMREGVCHFFFEKKDYSVREAFGTRDRTILEQFEGGVPENEDEDRNRNTGLVSFFDCTKKEWRCFRPECIIMVDTNYM